MINKDVIKEIIIEYQQKIPKIQLIERNIFIDSIPNYVFVGLRRSGKSYMMFADIQRRIKEKEAQIEDILYINFEDERLSGIELSDLSLILDCYRELFDNPNPLIYLDEIQNINGWEKYARRLSDSGRHVFITGSNAKMLSREIATTLGGRYIVKYIPTFSYSEFLRYHGVELSARWQYDRELKITLSKMLQDYFYFGGFAETFRLIQKREWLNSLYQKILLGDIVARNGFRNERAVALLVKKLAESVKQPSTQTRLLNILKSTGAKLSRNTIADYLDSLDNSYLTFALTNYRHSLAERVIETKRYFSDNGLLNIFLIDPQTSLIENLVAIELVNLYRYIRGYEVFYYRNGVEVDFYIPQERLAVQVSYSVSNPETLEREIHAVEGLRKAAEIDEAWIITYDDPESIIERSGLEIKIVPLMRFLLQCNFLFT